MTPALVSAPFRQGGGSICWQRTFSEVRQACMGFPEEVSDGRPHAASEPKVVAEGASQSCQFQEGTPARHIHELYRSLFGHLFTDMKTKDCLSIRSEDFA